MWLAGVVPYTLAPQRRWRICWGEGKGHPGAQTKSGFRGADLSVGPPRSFRLLPTAVKAGQVKGRDPGAQVSSSLPGQGGVGAGTSGLGKCPFGDVRSLSAAPPVPPHLALRVPAGTRPRRPTYTQVRRTCPLAPAGSRLRFLAQPLPRTASHTVASGRQPRVLWRLPAPRTAPVRPLHLLFG